MDDVCVWGTTKEEHDVRVRMVLGRMATAHMTLTNSKCVFSKNSIKFLGHLISAERIQASSEAVQGIHDFSTPEGISDVLSFLGMANQFSKFTTNLDELS